TRTRSLTEASSSHPRRAATHIAVKPKPVAATLEAFLAVPPSAEPRSSICPVLALACSQKYRKHACSTSSRNMSSSAVNRYREGSNENNLAGKAGVGSRGSSLSGSWVKLWLNVGYDGKTSGAV